MDEGEHDEFGDYVATRWARLVRSAVLLGCTPSEAEDVVQATLTTCLVHWAKVRRADDRDAYVHRILFHTFTSTRRRRWTRERPVADLPERHRETADTIDVTASYDAADALARSLRRLSPDQRAVVVLRYYAHLSERQTATALDVAPGTVKSRLSLALRLLAEDPHLKDLRGTP